MLSPIIVFAYNRPNHLRQTLEALSENYLADQSDLIIFCDGPKMNASPEQLDAIKEVRSIAHAKKWCKNVIVEESEYNKGLADSIVQGVSSVVAKYGRVIVLEDDIVTSRGFLRYMNDALDLYERDDQVMHISGYMYPHRIKLPNTFFCPLPLCWGWATWARSWKCYDGDAQKWMDYFNSEKAWERFNVFGGHILQKQLEDNANGTIKTWFIKWHSSVLFHNGLALFPGDSLVENIGMDNTGEHCFEDTRFSHKNLAEYTDVMRIPIKEYRRGRNTIMHFYQGHWYSKRNRRKAINTIISLFSSR